MTFENIPNHWTCQKLKYVASLKSGEGITSDNISENGEYPVFGGNGVRGFTSNYTHQGTYPLIGRQGALCGNINYASGKFWASEHAVVVKVKQGHHVRWLGEVLRSMNLNQYSLSAAQPGISVEVIENLSIPVPPEPEQELIADYLDWETTRIDALVAEKEKMLALLEEKRAALISRAVTRGLDPTAPLKPSGLDWLGEIPKHWDVLPLRWFMRIGSGEFLSNESISKDETDELLIPVVGGNGVLGYTSQANTEDALVVGRVGAQCGNVHFVNGPLWVTDNALLVKLTSRFEPRYLREVLHLMELNSLANQSAQPLITGEMVKTQKVPAPPMSEQIDILQILKDELGEFANLLKEVESSLHLLKERRAALITAAVTGQIPVEEMSA